MNREETRQKAEVMLAYADGKEVQWRPIASSGLWHEYKDGDTPGWNFINFEYRVKPEPKVRPWTVAEVAARMAERPLLVRTKEDVLQVAVQIIFTFGRPELVQFADGSSWSLEKLSERVQHDGSPCGVVE